MKHLYGSYIILLLICLCASSASSQELISYNEQGKVKKYFGTDKDETTPEQWHAKWIWGKGAPSGQNVMLCARRTFLLDRLPVESRLYITADTRYRLYVNGEFVNRGPARCAPQHQYYDIIDIAPLLITGKNVIAVRVHHLGTIIDFYQKPRPGLLFQLEMPSGSEKVFIVSDQETKVREESGWDQLTPLVLKQQQAFVENFDFRKTEVNWTDPGFNDSHWESAAVLRPEGWWPLKQTNDNDYACIPPWLSLVPRDLPYLEEKAKRVTSVFETGDCPEFSLTDGTAISHNPVLGVVQRQVHPLTKCLIKNIDPFLRGEEEMIVQNFYPKTLYSNEAIRSTWIVFDMGDLVTGYPRLNISASAGTEINVTYAPYLLEGKYNPALMWGNYGDRVTLSNQPVLWESEELKTFRYIGLLISNTDKPVKIAEVGIKQTWYHFSKTGSFKTDDVFIDKHWQASVKTLDLITHDAYTDNYQERRQYIQTGWYASRCNYATSGDPYLTRRLLLQIAQEQHPSGKMPMHAPGEPYAGILEADLHWHMTLYDYYMYTGDKKTVEYLLLNLMRSIRALEEMENKNGLIENPPYSYWIDWTTLDRRGINFTLNAWYMMALEQDARLLLLFDMEKEARNCNEKAIRIRDYLKANFWNAEKKLFVQTIFDNKQTGSYDEISNGIALITGIADKEQAGHIMKSIMGNDNTHVMVQPVLLMHWVIEGLFTRGYGKEAIQLLKYRYQNMLQHESATIWEQWNLYATKSEGNWKPRTWSCIQAEPVYSPDVFKRHLSGIEILKPGMTEVALSPKDFGLKTIFAAYPSPLGVLEINQTINKGRIHIEITVPVGMKVKVDLNIDEIMEKKMMSLDGQEIVISTLKDGILDIPEGKHILKFYLYLLI